MAFWFADADYQHARIVILGVPLDETATFLPGTRFGPERIRACAETVEAYSPYFKQNLADFSITGQGDLNLEGLPSMKDKLGKIRERVAAYLEDRKKPLLIGGEHTLTFGAVQAALGLHPDLTVLQLDAHADMRDVGEGGSSLSHDTVMRRVKEILKPDSLIQVGLRSFVKEEVEVPGVYRFRIDEIDSIRKGLEGCVTGRPVWLSFDLDLLNPSIMPAVGCPEPNGASYQQVIELLLGLKGLNFVGADVVEFNPLAADFIAPAVTAANLVREICCLLA